jgi:hypothetical protein
VEDVVFALLSLARVSAICNTGGIDRHLAGRGVVVEERVAPSAAVRNLLLSFSMKKACVGASGIHDEGAPRIALLEAPLELRDLGTFRERLAVAGNADMYAQS